MQDIYDEEETIGNNIATESAEGNDEGIKDAIKDTIDICIERGILSDFLESRREEVTNILQNLYNEEEIVKYYVAAEKADAREEGRKAAIEVLRGAGISEAEIASKLAEKFNLTQKSAEEYCKRILK